MMKKFKSFMLIAAAVLIGFSSCNNNEEYVPVVGPDGPGTQAGAMVSFTISIPGQTQTRAIGGNQEAYPVYLHDGVILLSNGTTILAARHIPPVNAIDGREEVFELVAPGINRAHFVGNTPLFGVGGIAGVATVEELVNRPLTDVTEHLIAVQTQMQSTDPMNPGRGNLVNIYRSGALAVEGQRQTVIDGVTTDVTIWGVELPLEPTVARLELFNVTGNAQIAGFTVQGIFVDRFYEYGHVGFNHPNAEWRMLGEGNATVYNYPTANFPTAEMGVFFDWHAGGIAATRVPNAVPHIAQGTAGLMRVTPGATPNIVWGYNLFAGVEAAGTPGNPGAVTGTRTPAIAIRLSHVSVNATREFSWDWQHPTTNVIYPRSFDVDIVIPHPMTRVVDNAWVAPTVDQLNTWYAMDVAAPVNEYPGTDLLIAHLQNQFSFTANPVLFVSIRGFTELNATTGFVPRHVYRIGGYHGSTTSTGSWTFGPDDLDDVAFRRAIDVRVEIEVMPWIPTDVNPIL